MHVICLLQAYKNYGARINTMKRKLDELMRTLPSASPPLPQEVPSPGNTPPHLEHMNAHSVDMDLDPMDSQPTVGQTEGAVLLDFVRVVSLSC